MAPKHMRNGHYVTQNPFTRLGKFLSRSNLTDICMFFVVVFLLCFFFCGGGGGREKG